MRPRRPGRIEFGTPLIVYDEDHVRARCREALAVFGDGAVAYAAKAFLCRAMAQLVRDEGLHLDVATGGELHVALAAGFPPERLVLHGNNKSAAELADAVDAGVGTHRGGQPRRVGPPRRPGRRTRLPAGCAAAGHAGRGGPHPRLPLDGPGRTPSSVSRCPPEPPPRPCSAQPRRRLGGSWWASTPTSAARCSASIPSSVRWPPWPRFANPLDLPELSVGGGLGVAYVTGEEAPSITAWGEAVLGAARRGRGCAPA